LREQRKTREWRTKREYPADLVAEVAAMYLAGQTISEIQSQVKGVKVQQLMSRCGITRRPSVKRDQRGPKNSSWRGDSASYAALHLRVASTRGTPSLCQWCETTNGRFEWANLTGDYTNVNDYDRLCVSCHRYYDAARRRLTGMSTMPPKGVTPYV